MSARPIDSHRVFPALSHCFACYLIPPLGIEPHSSLPKSCGDFVRRFERNKARSDETCLAIYPHQTATGQHHHSSHRRGVVMQRSSTFSIASTFQGPPGRDECSSGDPGRQVVHCVKQQAPLRGSSGGAEVGVTRILESSSQRQCFLLLQEAN